MAADRPPDPDQLLTEQEVADLLKFPSKTLREWRHRGFKDLPWHKLGARAIRYRRRDVVAFIERSRAV